MVFTCENDGPDRAVTSDLVRGGDKVVENGQCEGVQLAGTAKGDVGDAVLDDQPDLAVAGGGVVVVGAVRCCGGGRVFSVGCHGITLTHGCGAARGIAEAAWRGARRCSSSRGRECGRENFWR